MSICGEWRSATFDRRMPRPPPANIGDCEACSYALLHACALGCRPRRMHVQQPPANRQSTQHPPLPPPPPPSSTPLPAVTATTATATTAITPTAARLLLTM